MAQYSASASSGGSTSSSVSQPVQTPQSEYELNLSQLLANLGQDTYNWAQNQFSNAQNVTDANINSYINSANYSLGEANNLWGRYENTIEPLSNEYIQEAGSYASQPRINFNEGQAESNAGQAATQGENNEIQQLMSYGVNPSSGMYGELTSAANTARSASQASAGQEAGLSTEQTGRTMLQNAIAMGQQLPGASVNAMNASLEGLAGAENSILGLENTGVALEDAASPYYQAAMELKYPTNESTSNSSSHNTSQTQSVPANGSGGSSKSSYGAGSGNQATPTYNEYGGYGANSIGGGETISTGTVPNMNTNGGNYSSDVVNPTSFPTYTPDYATSEPSGQSYSPSAFGSYGGYARGGVIPSNATTGGPVPRTASPSLGRQTDDIPARLNAGEFVIPRDVMQWKGSEFFQKLIDQSRKARLAGQQSGQAAQGQMKPALNGPPRFVSHPVGRTT